MGGPLFEQAYSTDVFVRVSQEWQRMLTAHLRQITSGDSVVLNWEDPQTAIHEAESWLTRSEIDAPSTLTERAAAIMKKMLSSGQNLHHPHYIGHQVPAAVPLAGLFDAVSSVTNQVMAIYEMGPWATAVEHALVRTLCGKVGWDCETSAGLLTHGGSLANLTALLTARNVSLPGSWEEGVPSNAVLVTHEDAHYCVARSAGILGLGSNQVVKVALDEERRMDPRQLDAVLSGLQAEGRRIMAVSACACATPTGAFDRLQEISDVCRKYSVWLHVDAAHGGGLLMSRKYRSRLAGIELADSLVWDAHKMLFVPALCAAVLYRNRDHRFETFRQNAPYLFDPSMPGMADIDSGLRTVECTKRASGFGLWGLWSLLGERVFEQMVDRTIELAWSLYELLNESGDFVTLHKPECNILAFRYMPQSMDAAAPAAVDRFQRDLRTHLIRSGRFYIVQTTLSGRAALRVTVMNPMTTEQDLQELLSAIRDSGAAVLT
jgi:L-2,4-diaminobutyrate decarboxylase